MGKSLGRRTFEGLAQFTLAMAALIFVPAWTLAYWQAWLFLLLFCGACFAASYYFLARDPKLIERRMKAGPRAEKEPAQRVIMTIASIGWIGMIAASALDHRFHWSNVPDWVALAGDAGFALSFFCVVLVLRQNSYAASTIRVEDDQPVVDTGAYAVIRHPMYAAALPMFLSMPPALGSYWGLLVFAAIMPALIWRLLDEERFLRNNLLGYADYCRRVRWRLIPRVW
jgi:protein-S-isoprenylcysteine O-methyltransferase Ste14